MTTNGTIHFYAEENRHGRNTTTTIRRAGREIIVSAGNLYRFPSRKERDDWLQKGQRHRKALTAAEARRYHATGPMAKAIWEDANWGAMGQPQDTNSSSSRVSSGDYSTANLPSIPTLAIIAVSVGYYLRQCKQCKRY